MLLIKADVSNQKADVLYTTANVVLAKMTGNASFATPSPALATITTAAASLKAAMEAAKSGAHAAIADKKLAEKTLRALLVSLSRYVNSASNGDLKIALSSGFPEAKGHEPIVKLEAPRDLQTKLIANEGAVELKWKGSKGARMYELYMSTPENPTEWKSLATVSRTRHMAQGLISGSMYFFRVVALGAAGQSVPSDIVKAKAA